MKNFVKNIEWPRLMTIGTGTFPQGSKFALVRAYIPLVAFAGILDTPVIAGRTYVFFPSIVPLDTYVVVLKQEFYDWNSNVYSLDFIVEQAYYMTFPSPTQIPVNYDLLYMPPVVGRAAALRFKPFGYTDAPNFFDLPPQT